MMNKVLYNLDQRNDTTDAQKATARDNIGAASSSDVSSAISNAIGALAVTDTAVANKFVTAVSEADGKITVSRDQPAIADVSGLQDALDNIPRPKNGVLTIQKNGTQVATFSADQSSNATANITVPTKTSELTNDSGFITEAGAPKEIEYVENTSTFADIKAIVDAGKLPVYKVDTIPTGPSGYYCDRYMMTTYHYSESQGKSATFSGTAGNTIKTYKIDGMTNQWTITSMTVPDSLGAGNGIDILANTISAKVKTGGGLAADADGLYVLTHEVTFTESNGTITSSVPYANLVNWAANGIFIDAKLVHSTYGTMYGRCHRGSAPEFTFFYCKAGAFENDFEHVLRVILDNNSFVLRDEVVAPQAPYFTYKKVSNVWTLTTYSNRKSCTYAVFIGLCNAAMQVGTGFDGVLPCGVVGFPDGTSALLKASYLYDKSGTRYIQFATTYRDLVASPVKNMMVTVDISDSGATLNSYEV